MPGAGVIHAAIFAAGAVIGGGVAAIVTKRRTMQQGPIFPIQEEAIQKRVVSQVQLPETMGRADDAPTLLPVLKYGNPGPIADALVRKAYVAAYDRRLRHPAWTAEHLTQESLRRVSGQERESGDRGKSTFVEDVEVPSVFRATLKDYFRSGYDRGHMVPAADAKFTQQAMDETFLLSNIAPQVGDGFNRNYWAYLEEWCRQLTGQFQDVYVFTVPLYLPRQEADGKWRVTHEVIGNPPNVAVPTHFAKVVLTTRPTSPTRPDISEVAAGAFVLPNAVIPDNTPLTSFIMPVEAVERAAGLTLFSDAVKARSKHICQSTKCEVVVRRFDDALKNKNTLKAIGAPKGKC